METTLAARPLACHNGLNPEPTAIPSVPANHKIARIDFFRDDYLIAGELPTEQGRTVTPIETWQKVHVRPATVAGPPTAKDSGVLRIENIKLVSIAEGGWSRMQFTLLPISGKRIRVPGAVERSSGEICIDRYANIGRLEAFAADGTQVELEVRREPDADPPNSVRQQLVELPQNGAIITARFRKQSRFAPAITRLIANFVTEEGVDILNVSDNYRDLDTTPMTPFGSITDGVKIRVRPIRTTFKPGMALTFCFQAVNVSRKPICWRCSDRGYGGNAIVEVDGQAVSLPELKPEYIHGWAGDWICKNPCEWTVTLPETISFSKGRHVLSYSIVSRGGTYLNAHQKAIPLVNGRIISNETSFSME